MPHPYTMQLTLIGHNMPLLRILLILRKFRVGIESIEVNRKNSSHWKAKFVLDFQLSTRTDTVFKKIGRLFDVKNLKYSKGENLSAKTMTLK